MLMVAIAQSTPIDVRRFADPGARPKEFLLLRAGFDDPGGLPGPANALRGLASS